MTTPNHPTPADMSDVALLTARQCAEIGGMSLSWWHAEVQAGRAPAPVFRAPRCTRWRASDVRAYWLGLMANPQAVTQAAAVRKAQVAQRKRVSRTSGQ